MEIQLTIPEENENNKRESQQKIEIELPKGHPKIEKKGECPFMKMKQQERKKQQEDNILKERKEGGKCPYLMMKTPEIEEEEKEKEEEKKEKKQCPYQHVWDKKEKESKKEAKPINDAYENHMAISYIMMQWAKQAIKKEEMIEKDMTEYNLINITQPKNEKQIKILYDKASYMLQQGINMTQDERLKKACLQKSYEAIIASMCPFKTKIVTPSVFQPYNYQQENEPLPQQTISKSQKFLLGSLIGILISLYPMDNEEKVIEFALAVLEDEDEDEECLQIKMNILFCGVQHGHSKYQKSHDTLLATFECMPSIKKIPYQNYLIRRYLHMVDEQLKQQPLSESTKKECMSLYKKAELCIRQIEQDLLFEQQYSPVEKQKLMMQLQTYRNKISETMNAFRL